MRKSENGITLIALVITIIVLLILAGVTIATLTGDNGILTQSKKAKEEWELGKEEEASILEGYEGIIEETTSGGLWQLKLSTDKFSENVSINVYSKYYYLGMPNTLKEYKELYILKIMGMEETYTNLEEAICEMYFQVSDIEEVIQIMEGMDGTTWTRDDIVYGIFFDFEKGKNENDVLKLIGFSDENISQIETEYEKNKELQEQGIPEKYLNRTYKIIYPDGTEETVLGENLAIYKGEYSVNENNKSYTIKIVENEVEQELKINVRNFVKYPTYEDEYYTYQFDKNNQGYSVLAKDKTLSQYGDILENIDGINIVNLDDTFFKCSNLIQAPNIPKSVTSLNSTFSGCSNLEQAPEIPNGVTNMTHTFNACSKLTQAPKIPQGVITMKGTFRYTSITQAPELPDSVINIDQIYESCIKLVEVPDIPKSVKNMDYAFWKCTLLEEAPKIPEGVESMQNAFLDCTNLKQASEIPSTVKYIGSVFEDCTNLKGTLKINSQQIELKSGYDDKPGEESLLNTGTQGTGLTVIVPNDDVRELLIQNSGYNSSKVKIVASE